MNDQKLEQMRCVPCEGGVEKMPISQAQQQLANLNGWQLNDKATSISKRFEFKGFNKTMSFINAMAWIANQEMHHPDVTFGYNYCEIVFTTHAIEGLSQNDFICAAKVNQLLG